MPKTAVNENCPASRNEDNVRLAGQILSMQPIPVAHSMEESPNGKLRTCVLALHRLHDAPTLFRCSCVHLQSTMCGSTRDSPAHSARTYRKSSTQRGLDSPIMECRRRVQAGGTETGAASTGCDGDEFGKRSDALYGRVKFVDGVAGAYQLIELLDILALHRLELGQVEADSFHCT